MLNVKRSTVRQPKLSSAYLQFNHVLVCQPDRRRVELARQVKEEFSYVAPDFNVAVEVHGSFSQVMLWPFKNGAHNTDT